MDSFAFKERHRGSAFYPIRISRSDFRLMNSPIFNLPIFLFITPMFLFSGTFFPVSNLPQWVRPLALAFPLYHLRELARWFSLGIKETAPAASVGYLTLFILFFTGLALKVMRKRLIR
jgi:lipooligosaccharide transport system permease protein